MSKKLIIKLIALVSIIIILFVFFFTIPTNYRNNVRINTHHINAFDTETIQARVVVFSDLHLFYNYQIDDLKNVVDTIISSNPDILIFNGGFFSIEKYEKDEERNQEIIEILREIRPMYGKFAVLSQDDLKNQEIEAVLTQANFEIINNHKRDIRINDVRFDIVGLLNNDDVLNVFDTMSDETFNFVVSNDPIILENIQNFKIDVLVFGRTLGGQYNLPFIGTVFEDIREYPIYRGIHNINEIYVVFSNGLGIYQSSMRFRAPSSIELFILK